MKTKVLLLIAGAALVTVSFASVNRPQAKGTKTITSEVKQVEPIGGFVMEDKL